jgi:fibronectin type 3 domain-containing protein
MDGYMDSSVLAGQTYYYVVRAVTGAGLESIESTQVAVTVPTP